jgi:dienelactone hydrolase
MANIRAAHPYTLDGVTFDGLLVSDGVAPRPGVLVIHGWEGRSESQERFAVRLAASGYAAFCVDLYGDGRRGTTPETCQALMGPLMADRTLLRRRLLGAVDAAARLNGVLSTRMAAIGFCFGGLCALDLARANAPLRGVVSFHGVLSAPPGPPAIPRSTPHARSRRDRG